MDAWEVNTTNLHKYLFNFLASLDPVCYQKSANNSPIFRVQQCTGAGLTGSESILQ